MDLTPPTDLFSFKLLPPDTQRKLALDLDYENILNLCKTEKSLNENICQNPYFWRDKILKQFGRNRVAER